MSTSNKDFELRVSFHVFLPLIDVLWEQNVRDNFSFLKSHTQTTQLLLKEYQSKQERATYGHINGFGKLKFLWSDDNRIYLWTIISQIKNNLPFRPLVPLGPNSIPWRAINQLSPRINNARLFIRIYPSLVAEIEGTFSITNPIDENIIQLIRNAKKVFWDEAVNRKRSILQAIFCDFQDIYLPLSTILIFVEGSYTHFDRLQLNYSITDFERLAGCWAKEIEKNFWFVMYGRANPSKRLRKRIKRAFVSAVLVRSLQDYAKDLFNRLNLQDLNFLQKYEYLEFLLNHLDPDLYSSQYGKTYYLPKHYQRLLFKNLETKFKGAQHFQYILTKLADTISTLPSEEQLVVLHLKGANVIEFRKKIKIDFEGATLKQIDDDRKRALLDFIVEHFKDNIKQFGARITAEQLRTKNLALCGLTLTKIRNNIQQWLANNNKEPTLISQNELKSSDAEILKDLINEGLIEILPSPKGNIKGFYIPNFTHPYIKKLLFAT